MEDEQTQSKAPDSAQPPDNKGGGKPKEKEGVLASLFGWLVVGEILFAGAGFWIDWNFGTLPWGVMIGMALGFVVGFYWFISDALKKK